MFASWVSLRFGVLGLNSVKFLAHDGNFVNTNAFSSSFLPILDIGITGWDYCSYSLGSNPNIPLLTSFWHLLRTCYLPFAPIICGLVTPPSVCSLHRGPQQQSGTKAGHHVHLRCQETNAQGHEWWASITNTTLERLEAGGHVLCCSKNKTVYGSDQAWFLSSKHSLNMSVCQALC